MPENNNSSDNNSAGDPSAPEKDVLPVEDRNRLPESL